MDDPEFSADDFDSDTSTASDQDLPESDSSPEPAHRLSIPVLASREPHSSGPSRHRRPEVPPVTLPTAISAGKTAQSQQSVSIPRLSLQADQAIPRHEPAAAQKAAKEIAEASGRNDQELSLHDADMHGSRVQPNTAPLFTVQLASEAFSIHDEDLQDHRYSSLSQTQAVQQFCATELGLRLSSLKFYELREVQSLAECSEGCTQLAIAVEGSGMTTSLCAALHCSHKFE